MRDYLSAMAGRVYRVRFRGKLYTDNRTLSFRVLLRSFDSPFKNKINPQLDYYLVAYQSAPINRRFKANEWILACFICFSYFYLKYTVYNTHIPLTI